MASVTHDFTYDHRVGRYNAGWDMHRAGQPRPVDGCQAEGWDARASAVAISCAAYQVGPGASFNMRVAP